MIKRALTNTGWLMGARGVNAVLSLAYLALATRSLGLAGFGQFILIVTFAQAMVGFVTFQSWQVVVRWGQTKDTLGDATGFAIALDALSMVAGALAAALVLWLAGPWLPLPPELRPEAYAYTLVLLFTLRSTPTGILRLHDRYARAATADSVTSIVRVIGAGLAALHPRSRRSCWFGPWAKWPRRRHTGFSRGRPSPCSGAMPACAGSRQPGRGCGALLPAHRCQECSRSLRVRCWCWCWAGWADRRWRGFTGWPRSLAKAC